MSHHNDLGPVRINRQWKNQKGMTAIGIAVILIMIAFFALIGMRLFPIYMEHFSVTTHLGNLAKNNMQAKTNPEILSKLMKSFQIDDVKNVDKENIKIVRHATGGTSVTIEYEVRTPALGNVDLTVSFIDEVDLN